jgi:tetratricopeptide (TPR) repeat protein
MNHELGRKLSSLAFVLGVGFFGIEPSFAEEEAVTVVDPERAAARVVFEGGVQAYREKRYEDAIELFTRANQIKPSPAFSFNIGIAYQDLGDVPMALRYYREYLRLEPEAPDRAEVSERVQQLEAKLEATGLQQLTVLTEPPGAAILIDGELMGSSPWTGELTPGTHRFVIKLQGYAPAQRDIELPRDEAIDVAVVLSREVAKPRPKPAPPAPKLQPRPIPWYKDVRPVSWGVMGVGVASLAVSGMLEYSRGNAQSDAEDADDTAVRDELLDTAESRRTWADAFLLLGLGMSATSAVLMFTDVAEARHYRRQRQDAAWLGGCGARGCSVIYRGSF